MTTFDRYQFPQNAPPMVTGERGIASLQHPAVGTFRFRSNPKEFNWSYTLNKRVDQTYGGRVIQLLGTRIDDFSFKADCGAGRWEYMNRAAKFMRDVMIAQRGGTPATFEYTTRGWRFNAFVNNVPFADAVEEVLREFEVGLKVQEDVSGLMSRNTIQAELRRLKDGVAFRRSKYNDPLFPANQNGIPQPDMGPVTEIVSAVANLAQRFLPLDLEANIRQAGGNLIENLIRGGDNG